MPVTYLNCPFAQRNEAKALGARWDNERRSWYVPDGLDLTPFAAWLPAGARQVQPTPPAEPARDEAVRANGQPATLSTRALAPAGASGANAALAARAPTAMSLSALLESVAATVSRAHPSAVWVTLEVVQVKLSRGHVYLEVTETSPQGVQLAKAQAVIWANRAQSIVPRFQEESGAQLAPGIKLLVRARPTFKAQYGFSLEIDALDSQYTMGDLEAKRREIRERLHREGLFGRNKQLQAPWDYTRVLVMSPPNAAGLGDFEAEARRLQRHGVCEFIFIHEAFQGQGAASGIAGRLKRALADLREREQWPDAVVIIRGGGAVNDLAWLDDYELARAVCTMPVPVLTGIGHERDKSILDEVAHTAYDTPSKVIAGIERHIVQRAQDVRDAFAAIEAGARDALQRVNLALSSAHAGVAASARLALTKRRAATHDAIREVRSLARESVAHVRAQARRDWEFTHSRSLMGIQEARLGSSAAMEQVSHGARLMLHSQRRLAQQNASLAFERAAQGVRSLRRETQDSMRAIERAARGALSTARAQATALMREVAGQGPQKTLGRGFAIVRTPEGEVVTSSHTQARAVVVQFHDGRREAVLNPENES